MMMNNETIEKAILGIYDSIRIGSVTPELENIIRKLKLEKELKDIKCPKCGNNRYFELIDDCVVCDLCLYEGKKVAVI